MAFSYHPPTRCQCNVCEELEKRNKEIPLIDTQLGKASVSNGYPFHDWYNFVLGFTPTFPEYMIEREGIQPGDGKLVLDPFNGSGTTQLVCKLKGIPSYGIDANDYMVFAAKQKLNWTIDPNYLRDLKLVVDRKYAEKVATINWDDENEISKIADDDRPKALDKRYISDKPLVKVKCLKEVISEQIKEENYHDLFMFIVSSILVPVSNVKYGPGFGIGKEKEDVDVIGYFNEKINIVIHDLSIVTVHQKETMTETILGDSRQLTKYIGENKVALMITSPPYPGDHEYTKHSKLELIFQGYANDLNSFRTIKKRMIRGSTTNIYKEDAEKVLVSDIEEIQFVTSEIDARLRHDNATSGFEKLYTKLVWEYFGGMYNTLSECYNVLQPGGKIALLVSDSHAFKMVHIETAEILKKIGEKIGYVNGEILLWQNKISTSHKYQLRENILILHKPFNI